MFLLIGLFEALIDRGAFMDAPVAINSSISLFLTVIKA